MLVPALIFWAGNGLAQEKSEPKLSAPIPDVEKAEEPQPIEQNGDKPREWGANPGLGLEFMYRNRPPDGAGPILRYDELLTLIANRQIESVTIDRDLSIALARPIKDSEALEAERLVSLPYWSFRDSPDFVLRQMCESYGTALIIAAEGDHVVMDQEKSIFASLEFWALIGTGVNLILLLTVLIRLRSSPRSKET